jgi:hypothetical protein
MKRLSFGLLSLFFAPFNADELQVGKGDLPA